MQRKNLFNSKKIILFCVSFLFMANSFASIFVSDREETKREVEVKWLWFADEGKDSYCSNLGEEQENLKNQLSYWNISLCIRKGLSREEKPKVLVWLVDLVAYHRVGPHDYDNNPGDTLFYKDEFGLGEKGVVINLNSDKEESRVKHPTQDEDHIDQYFLKFNLIGGSSLSKIKLEGNHLVYLTSFDVTYEMDGNHLIWSSGAEINNAGFRIWRAIDKGTDDVDIFTLEQLSLDKKNLIALPIERGVSSLIPAKGNEREGTSYSFVDINSQEKNITFYYLLEDVDFTGKRTFHCDKIQAKKVGQGPVVDLESAREFCRSQCDEEKSVVKCN